jgi:TonB family protein
MKNLFSIYSALFLLAISSIDAKAQINDFLNTYFKNQTPLNNNTFSFSLSKVVLGQKLYFDGNYSGGREVLNLTEFLDVSSLTYYGISPNIQLNSRPKFDDIVVKKNFEWFISKMPKIEILRNKLVTLNYSDGKSESFLYKVSKLSTSEGNNNFRNVLKIELDAEEVTNDRENPLKGNIIWRVLVLNDEAYLALSGIQLNRLHVGLFDVGDLRTTPESMNGIQVSNDGKTLRLIDLRTESYLNYTTTGNGVYLARTKDKFMDGGYYLNPSEIIFLFKLNQIFIAEDKNSNNEISAEPEIAPLVAPIEEIFTAVEQQAEFPGGPSAFGRFLQNTLKYPSKARRANVGGEVSVSFVVNTDGSVQDAQVLKGVGFGCDEEAIRVIKAMPRWNPGMQSGRAVRSRFTLPIKFLASDE